MAAAKQTHLNTRQITWAEVRKTNIKPPKAKNNLNESSSNHDKVEVSSTVRDNSVGSAIKK